MNPTKEGWGVAVIASALMIVGLCWALLSMPTYSQRNKEPAPAQVQLENKNAALSHEGDKQPKQSLNDATVKRAVQFSPSQVQKILQLLKLDGMSADQLLHIRYELEQAALPANSSGDFDNQLVHFALSSSVKSAYLTELKQLQHKVAAMTSFPDGMSKQQYLNRQIKQVRARYDQLVSE